MPTTDASLLPEWWNPLVSPGHVRRHGTAPVRRGIIARLWTRFRVWEAQRETLRLLHAVDGATLRDLGISPPEIEGLVYGRNEDRIRGYDSDWWRK
ncbi:MAG TPA: DUF1127 domain-containing protein [Beijerinckiaceae bacterium]|jgi:uncharacterized protein YjiS (DUF1127 family)